jgi:hypothetical protein
MTDTEALASEPDYTLTIVEENGGFVVCEGGIEISKPFENRQEAERWSEYHRRWHQPSCCVCGSAITRLDDPWDAYSVDRYGPDWVRQSCGRKLRECGG